MIIHLGQEVQINKNNYKITNTVRKQKTYLIYFRRYSDVELFK